MSITFFSVFFPEIFHTEIKNKFITDKQKSLSPKQKQKNLLEKLDTEYCKTNTNKNIRILKTKTKYFRTSENISTNNTNNNLHKVVYAPIPPTNMKNLIFWEEGIIMDVKIENKGTYLE